ncbi:hypothetical protein F2Q70_00025503 [Brassica cretica]|uniref:Uncharacterized protein n=1 Tax=Brassica cretica TaxID=69181 RepID=A0A8S9L7G2_BRACR|nr:hypothetical protein F2Q70_00025503 [Brassica cretica]
MHKPPLRLSLSISLSLSLSLRGLNRRRINPALSRWLSSKRRNRDLYRWLSWRGKTTNRLLALLKGENDEASHGGSPRRGNDESLRVSLSLRL